MLSKKLTSKIFSSLFTIILLLANVQPVHAAGILYVKPGKVGNCSSWSNACSLQSAISAASSGDEIWVAAGVYKPTAGTDPGISFVLKNGVSIYGGFAGSETLRTQRNPTTHKTVLSGKIGGYNSLHVVTGNDIDSSTILDGFTISDGRSSANGGGLSNNNSSPTIQNVIFSNNYASDGGGGMYNGNNSSPTLFNVTFTNNTAFDKGGGMLNENNCDPSLTNVSFNGNFSNNAGGGMANDVGSSSILTNVIFTNNKATAMGGGTLLNGSGAILSNVLFSGNSAGSGGGIYNANGDITITNSTFFNNTAINYDGGGIYNLSSTPRLTNVTFTGNSAARYGGGIYTHFGTPIIGNSIFWGDSGGEIRGYGNGGINAHVDSSLIQGNENYGSINSDPLLGALTNNGGFTPTMALLPGSPAIDMGNIYSCPNTDQRGLMRPQGEGCDIGAFEYTDNPLVLSINRLGSTPTSDTNVSFIVEFSNPVTGVTADDFTLTTSGVSGAAVTKVSGTGRIYTITVNAGTGEGIIRLDLLDDDTIKNTEGNPLGGAGEGNGDFTDGQTYNIIKAMLTVVSSSCTDIAPTATDTVNFAVTFSKPVTGVDSSDFNLTTTGVLNASIAEVNGSETTYTVTVNTGQGSGTVRLDVLNDSSIIDVYSNPLNNVFVSGQACIIDKTSPVTSLITRVNTISISGSMDFTVTFSEPVTNVDVEGPQFDDFALTVSPSINGASIVGVSGSDTGYTVTVNTGSGNGTIRLDVPDTATINDLAGNSLTGLPFTGGEAVALVTTTRLSTAANDGWTLESSEYSSRANARSASGNLLVGDNAKNRQYRSLLYFDTSSLPDNAVVTSATLKIMQEGITGTDPFTTHGTPFAEMKNNFFGKSPLENADFQAVAYPKRSIGNFVPVNGEPGWYELIINPANFKYVNLKGVTQFRIRFTKDDDNDKVADFISFYSGDDATNPPQLIVEYIMP